MNDIDINLQEAYQETYDQIKIGGRVQIMSSEGRKITWVFGTVMDKHMSNFLGNRWGTYPQPFVDVLLDTGEVIEKYQCYALFYPRIDFF